MFTVSVLRTDRRPRFPGYARKTGAFYPQLRANNDQSGTHGQSTRRADSECSLYCIMAQSIIIDRNQEQINGAGDGKVKIWRSARRVKKVDEEIFRERRLRRGEPLKQDPFRAPVQIIKTNQTQRVKEQFFQHGMEKITELNVFLFQLVPILFDFPQLSKNKDRKQYTDQHCKKAGCAGIIERAFTYVEMNQAVYDAFSQNVKQENGQKT